MAELKHIFLVDDDETFVFLTKEVISFTDVKTQITEFSDGQVAIDYFQENYNKPEKLPDIILLDLHMHIMDGWDFLKEYANLERKFSKKVKLYVVSSSISPHDIERSKNFKVIEEFIIKPLEQLKFEEIIDGLNQNA